MWSEFLSGLSEFLREFPWGVLVCAVAGGWFGGLTNLLTRIGHGGNKYYLDGTHISELPVGPLLQESLIGVAGAAAMLAVLIWKGTLTEKSVTGLDYLLVGY